LVVVKVKPPLDMLFICALTHWVLSITWFVAGFKCSVVKKISRGTMENNEGESVKKDAHKKSGAVKDAG
jgi:hypothetical protein